MKFLRGLYDWGLEQARSRHAEWALFWVAFAESSFFPLPPDVLLIATVLADRQKWLRFFSIALAGSVLGGMAGYLLGMGLWEVVHPWFFAHVFSEATFEKVRRLYIRYDFWAVFTAAFTPIPYKVFTIAAGVTAINFIVFVLASIVGRGGRFFLVAFLLFWYGPPIRSFVERYLNWITLVFTVLLIGGFFVLRHGLP